jgi:glucosylceramidase
MRAMSASRLLLRSSLLLFAGLGALLRAQAPAGPEPIRWWASTEDLRLRLDEQPPLTWHASTQLEGPVIDVNPLESYQTVVGMGSSLEPATCWNLSRMSAVDRERTIARLVSPTVGIGMNLMRICIGTPDFTGDPWYSYDDLPPGETDPELRRFSIEKDRAYILPVLRQARAANEDLRFFASPWSPPGWMKSTGTLIGGYLLPRWYSAYAEYLVRFIEAYEAEGIPIHAVTIQNEPGVDRSFEKDPKWHYPSCRWTAAQEQEFIRDHLGPALRRRGLGARIWAYDHNYNVEPRIGDAGLAYPRTVLSDPAAAQFVGGVAFHGYVGKPTGMTVFHGEFPGVPIHFTEGSVFGLEGAVTLVDTFRNFASSYNAWVSLLDERGKPNNGPFDASRTMITTDSTTRKPTEHFDFFLYGQFMRFVQRGAVRIGSTAGGSTPANVAFRNPDASLVLVVVNAGRARQAITLRMGTRTAAADLAAASVATFTWRPQGKPAFPVVAAPAGPVDAR